jgi:hypothetical protein
MRDGVYVEPEPFWDLTLAQNLGIDLLARAQLKDAPPDRVEMLRKWIQACRDRLKDAAAADAAAQAQTAAPPNGAPPNGAGAMPMGAPAPAGA